VCIFRTKTQGKKQGTGNKKGKGIRGDKKRGKVKRRQGDGEHNRGSIHIQGGVGQRYYRKQRKRKDKTDMEDVRDIGKREG